ncbi:MAG TPA: rhomboid family intramembrane serine protease, partial [Bacteroidia bacterium]|nr:rhomboid family intramembrane serine protease [Bacteroidia bacterium]
MQLIVDIKNRFQNGDVLTRLILVNIAVFLLINFGKLIAWFGLFDGQWMDVIVHKLSFAEYLPVLITQPWSIITYMFTHESLSHIFWNLIVLYWVGQLILEYMGEKKLWAIYFLGGLCAIIFMWVSLYILQFAGTISGRNQFLITPHAYALGASGSINACLVAIATLIPNYTLYLFLIGPVRLKYVALVVILLSAISIPNGNAGGEIAHLGGALFGYLYTKQLQQGRDVGAWFNKLSRWRLKPKSKMKLAHKSKEPKSNMHYD